MSTLTVAKNITTHFFYAARNNSLHASYVGVNIVCMKTILSKASKNTSEAAVVPPRFGRLIAGIYRQWRRQVDISFKELDLSDATRMPLLALYEQGAPMRQKELAQSLGLDTSSLVRVLDQLRERELLDWECDPTDRRTKCIALTVRGHKVTGLILEKSRDIEHTILADLSPQELTVLHTALAKIARRFDDL